MTVAIARLATVPGLLGSQMQVKVNRAVPLNPLCKTSDDWLEMWASVELVVPGFDTCFANFTK